MLSKFKFTANKKNIFKISSGTILGQIVSIITIPFVARLYGAEILGIWALVHSISVIVNSFSDLGLTYSLMTQDEKHNLKTYRVITTIVAMVSVIIFVVLFLYNLILFGFKPNTLLAPIFIMIIIFTSQQIQVSYTWLNRRAEYNVLMKNPLINNGVYGVIAIVLGFIGITNFGFFIAHMIGRIVTLLHMRRSLPKGLFTYDLGDFISCIKNNGNYIRYQMPSNIISNLKNQSPILLIERLWGTEILGYYSITVNILQIPISFLANAIGRVFLQIVSTMKREGKNIGEFVLGNMIKGMKIAILPMALLMAFGDIAIDIFFGSEWEIAGNFVRILALQYYFMFLLTSVQGIALTLKKQKYSMIMNIGQLLGYIIGIFLGKYIFDNMYIALLLMSVLFILIQIVYFSYLFNIMKVSVKKYIIYSFFSSIILLAIAYILRCVINYAGIIEFISKSF